VAIKIKSTALRLWFRFRLSFSLFWENFSLSFLLSLDLKVELETGTLFLAFISVCFVCLALLQFSQLGFFPFFFPAQQINITKILSSYKHSTLLLIDYICMYVIVHRELVLNNENKVELSFLTAAF